MDSALPSAVFIANPTLLKKKDSGFWHDLPTVTGEKTAEPGSVPSISSHKPNILSTTSGENILLYFVLRFFKPLNLIISMQLICKAWKPEIVYAYITKHYHNFY